jgi:hypothetical protein
MSVKGVAVAAAVVAAVAAALAYGTEMYAEGWAVRQVDAFLARPPFTHATHGRVSYSLLRGKLTVEAIAGETAWQSLPSFRLGRIELDGISQSDVLGLAHDPLRLDALRLDAVDARTAPGGQIHSDRILVVEPALAPAGSAAPDSDDIPDLAGVTAARLVVDGFRRETVGEGGAALAAQTIRSERIADGKIGSGVVINATIAMADGAGVALGEAHLQDFDILGWLRAVAAARADGPVDLNLPGRITVSKVALRRGRITATADKASSDGVRIRASLAHEEGAISVTIDRLQFWQLGAADERGTVKLGSFELSGFATDIPEGDKGRMRMFINRLRLVDLAAAEGERTMAMKELLLTMSGTLAAPTSSALKVSAIDVSAGAEPWIRLAGYNRLQADITADSAIDSGQHLIEGRFELAVAEAGTLGASFRLLADPDDPGPVAIKRLDETRLQRFELRYEDASLVDRLLRIYAQQRHRSLAAAREEIIALIDAERADVADRPQLLASLDAVAAFVRKPGTLTLSATPQEPVALSDLPAQVRDPAAFAALLGLAIH